MARPRHAFDGAGMWNVGLSRPPGANRRYVLFCSDPASPGLPRAGPTVGFAWRMGRTRFAGVLRQRITPTRKLSSAFATCPSGARRLVREALTPASVPRSLTAAVERAQRTPRFEGPFQNRVLSVAVSAIARSHSAQLSIVGAIIERKTANSV